MPWPLPLRPCATPGQQQDTLQVGVGSHQPPPASSLLHACDYHTTAIPGEQGLQGLHCAAGGREGSGQEGSEGREGAEPALRSPSVQPSPGVAVQWPLVGWGPNLGGVGGACAPGQLMQLRD